MKVTKFPRRLRRRYLRLASVYRRYAGRDPSFDFSLEALQECYDHESTGIAASKSNGYVYGKWCKDISVVTWIEDIHKGDACKAEFIYGIDGWWSKAALEDVVVLTPWFPFDRKFLNGKK